MALLALQRETDDWIPRTIVQQGSAYTGDWSYQIVAYEARPDDDDWLAAVDNGGALGVNISGLTQGVYEIYYRIDGQGSYEPVLDPDKLVIR